MTLRLGTRRSALALAQATWVADRLRSFGHDVELVEIVTEGDLSTAPLASLGGTGVFATALRRALHRGEIDLAVHSLKDLPTAAEPGLRIAAVPAREDPRDVLVARDGLTLGELPEGSTVGTGSPRRRAQLAALGLGLRVRDLRGNVDSRLARVASGDLDAVVLARAGLVRLGRLAEATETLDPLQMLPAPGQGALAVECRDADDPTATLLSQLDDADTRACVTAERSVLAALEAGCSAPVGALAEIVEGEDGTELSLRAFAGTLDGTVALRRSLVGPVVQAEDVGRRLAEIMLEDGAAGLMTSNQPTQAIHPRTSGRPAQATHPRTSGRPAQATHPPTSYQPTQPDGIPAGASGTPPLAGPKDHRPESTYSERSL
jgi:hydroxymethylbilane synthase